VRDLRSAVAGLVVATDLLTGCSEKQEASTTLPTTSAAETTEVLPQLGPADFPVPDEARTKDAAGADAFLRYYIELSNRQQELLDGDPFATSHRTVASACVLRRTSTTPQRRDTTTKAGSSPLTMSLKP
jgi:hypothetical protein